MALFAIADTHLSFGVKKPMDIFEGWTDYVQRLENNWRNIVKDDDTVVIAGDISWGLSFEQSYEDFKFLNELPGQKIILKGNHDYWWNTRKKMDNFFLENGFNTIKIVHNDCVSVGEFAVCGTRGWFFDAEQEQDKKVLMREVGRLKTSIQAAKKTGLEPVVFLHYPPIYENKVCDEIYNVLVEEKIKRCYYGHLHGYATIKAFNGDKDGIKFRLVSCDYTKFCPIIV